MGLAEELHAARKARLARLSPSPRMPVRIAWHPVVQPDPHPAEAGWENMWFYDLVSSRARPPSKISVRDIQIAVAEHYCVDVSDILSHRRTRDIATPRHVAMYLTKKLTHRSLPEIGRLFGRRDHTTIIHAVRKIEALCETDSVLFGAITQLRRRFI